MEAARATWTDSRLDDLNDRVKSMDKKMDIGFARLDERIDGTNDRIDALQHTIMTVGGALVAALLGLTAAMLGTMVTLLVTHL
jgi:hypothetical protein